MGACSILFLQLSEEERANSPKQIRLTSMLSSSLKKSQSGCLPRGCLKALPKCAYADFVDASVIQTSLHIQVIYFHWNNRRTEQKRRPYPSLMQVALEKTNSSKKLSCFLIQQYENSSFPNFPISVKPSAELLTMKFGNHGRSMKEERCSQGWALCKFESSPAWDLQPGLAKGRWRICCSVMTSRGEQGTC